MTTRPPDLEIEIDARDFAPVTILRACTWDGAPEAWLYVDVGARTVASVPLTTAHARALRDWLNDYLKPSSPPTF